MSIWYQAWSVLNTISVVDVEKFTDASVWVSGRRKERIGSSEAYFPTWAEAKEFLLAVSTREILSIRWRLESANSRHANLVGMKEPTP